IAAAEQLVGPHVDVFLDKMHGTIREQKVRTPRMTGPEAKDDPPVIAGSRRIVRRLCRLPVLIQLAISIRTDLVVDGDDRAIDVVAAVAKGPVASGIGEVAGTGYVSVLAGQSLADHQRVGKAIRYVGQTKGECVKAVKKTSKLPFARN